jgi:hypothetical protein
MADNYFGGDPLKKSAGKANPSLGETPVREPLGAVRESVTDLGAYDLDKL